LASGQHFHGSKIWINVPYIRLRLVTLMVQVHVLSKQIQRLAHAQQRAKYIGHHDQMQLNKHINNQKRPNEDARFPN
jgi:hypothetical protein